MNKIILSINAGSSSLRVAVYSASQGQDPLQIAELQVDGLTAPPPTLDYSRGGKKIIKRRPVGDRVHGRDDAFDLLLQTLVDDQDMVEIADRGDVSIACHRIVHGGDFAEPQVVGRETFDSLEALNDLAPLHNARGLAIVRSCIHALPGATNVACPDTLFHTTIPRHVRTYPINPGVAASNKLRKYGFHGISYAFITRSVAGFLGKSPRETNLIALHLGSGASACAIRGGESWDTSMGLTPLAGLPGATRSGSVDPSLVFHYASDVGKLSPSSTRDLHISRAEEILNKESGWSALAGTTDFATVAAAADAAGPDDGSGDGDGGDLKERRLAFDLVVDRVSAFVGSYYVSLGGDVDALVFAGGIGEHCAPLRAAVADQARCLGFAVDSARNGEVDDDSLAAKSVIDITAPGARHRVLVCRTDEQFEMARACAHNDQLW